MAKSDHKEHYVNVVRTSDKAMELAYLTTEYPAVSHTFIRREILELEERGHRVHRFSIRECTHISDSVDKLERKKTYYCLSQGMFRLLFDTLYVGVTRPKSWLNAFRMTLALNKNSDRGLVRHFAYLAEASNLLREINRRNLGHIHVHFGTNVTSVALLLRVLGGPTYSFTVHGPDEFDAPIGFSLERKISNAEFVIAISHFGSAQLKRWALLEDWEKIKIVYCSLSDDFFKPTPPIKASSKTILCVGRLAAQKGHLFLLDAVKLLTQKGVELELVLVGDGELRHVLENRICELGIENFVTITGWVDGKKIKKLLAASRGLVLPSFAEGLPVVIMEAFSSKRPVVSTYVSGIPELVINGENGFLSVAGDTYSLAEAIKLLMNTPVEQLNIMGHRGYEMVKERHHVKTQVAALEKQFRKVLSQTA